MPATRVPANIVDGKSPPFPPGSYVGTLTTVATEWYASDRKNAPDTKDSLRLALTFKEITPVDGTPVGNRPLIQRVDVVRKNQHIAEITEFGEETHFAFRQAYTLLSQLALALNAVQRNGDGSLDLDTQQFLDGLQGGVYNNQTVMFVVEQRSYDSKDQKNANGSAKKMTVSNITAFASFDDGQNGAAEVEAQSAPAPAIPASVTERPMSLRTR